MANIVYLHIRFGILPLRRDAISLSTFESCDRTSANLMGLIGVGLTRVIPLSKPSLQLRDSGKIKQVFSQHF